MAAGSVTLSDINFVEQLVVAAAAASVTPAQLGAGTLPSTATGTTAAVNTATTALATTAFVQAAGWNRISTVASADATTTGQTLVDVTGLTAAVAAASVYEFEAILKVVASADTNGMKVGVSCTQTMPTVSALVIGNTTTTTAIVQALIAADTANATALNTSSAGIGIIRLNGQFETHATVAGTFSIQHVKLTSGTSTVKVGSTLKIRKVG